MKKLMPLVDVTKPKNCFLTGTCSFSEIRPYRLLGPLQVQGGDLLLVLTVGGCLLPLSGTGNGSCAKLGVEPVPDVARFKPGVCSATCFQTSEMQLEPSSQVHGDWEVTLQMRS